MSSSSDADGEPPGLPSPRASSRAVCAAARRRFAASTRSLAPPLPPLGPAPACKESTRRFEAGSTEMLNMSCSVDNRLKQHGLRDVIGTACVQCSVSRKSLSAASCSAGCPTCTARVAISQETSSSCKMACIGDRLMLAAFPTLAETVLAQQSSPARPEWPLARSPCPPRIRRSARRHAPGGRVTWPPPPPPRRRCPRSRSGPVMPKQGVCDWPACAVWDDVSCHMRTCSLRSPRWFHPTAVQQVLHIAGCRRTGAAAWAPDGVQQNPKQPGQPSASGALRGAVRSTTSKGEQREAKSTEQIQAAFSREMAGAGLVRQRTGAFGRQLII